MSLPAASRRRPRIAAAALLLILHGVAILLFMHLRTTRERADDRLVTLRLMAPARRPVAAPSATLPRPPRPLVAPIPAVQVDPPRDAASPIATPEAGASAPAPAAAGPASAPLNLAIPKEFYTHPPPLTPAQEAMEDPRSNRLVLTRQEKMDIAFGVVECIAWQRQADGSIYRGPGHLQRIQGIGTNPFTAHKPGQEDRPVECVR